MSCTTVGALCISFACGGLLLGLAFGSLATWVAWCAHVRRLVGGPHD